MLLLRNVFQWSREINPIQPLSAGVWNKDLTDLNHFQLTASDVITYHNYEDEKAHQQAIDSLRKYGRPSNLHGIYGPSSQQYFFQYYAHVEKRKKSAPLTGDW